MQFGAQFFPSASSMSPIDFARAAEDRGFESVFFPDHTHVPLASVTASTSGEAVPEFYRSVMDPLVVLGAVAAATTRIRLGTAVLLVTQRDPVVTAKQVATADQLSGGRILLGVGAGSNDHELRTHGTDPATRFRLLEERLGAMSRIWDDEIASYAGELVHLEPMWSEPKPLQRPRPPVLIGGSGPTVLDRVLRYADGWMPFRQGTTQVTDRPSGDVEDMEGPLQRRVAELRSRADDGGRTRPSVTLFNPLPHLDAVARYAEMGVDRVVFWLPTADASALLPILDALQTLIEHHR